MDELGTSALYSDHSEPLEWGASSSLVVEQIMIVSVFILSYSFICISRSRTSFAHEPVARSPARLGREPEMEEKRFLVITRIDLIKESDGVFVDVIPFFQEIDRDSIVGEIHKEYMRL